MEAQVNDKSKVMFRKESQTKEIWRRFRKSKGAVILDLYCS